MPDDPKKRGAPDRRRIAISQRHERVRTCKALRIDELHLMLCVMMVGDSRALVKDALATARSLLGAHKRRKSSKRGKAIK